MFYMKELTKRQAELLDLVERSSIPPTLREIGRKMDIVSTNGVQEHIYALHRKNRLRTPTGDRAISRGLCVIAPLTPEERVTFGLGELRRCPTCGHRVDGKE